MDQDRPDQPDGARSPACAGAVDPLRDAFERQWKADQRPEIEEFLHGVDASQRPELLRELVALEVAYRRRAGEEVGLEEYQQRFPEFAGPLRDAWRLLISRRERDALASRDVSQSGNTDVPSQREPDTVGNAASQTTPSQFGRYQIQTVLGMGGFGTVYLAVDPQLQRPVALKVPHRSWIGAAEQCGMYLHEARAAAQLKHPGLVAVYDVQQKGDSVYIVQEYVDGQDLGRWAASVQPDATRIARLMIETVEAVGYAHQQGLVHRDLKPANILVDRRGHAHVADFGLALNESLQQLKRGETCGTPAYMSPEQVRGETHRLDGRSDLWSLGVILYELLTGRRPFAGDGSFALFDEIQYRDPKPPRMIRPEIPAELERIVLKCLVKRATDRFGSAAELAEDLGAWLIRSAEPARPKTVESAATALPPCIVPKGLRSFDEQDADFFLELLPGPRDREGLPESIRFWKSRIEETDPDNTFAVALIYGPSGCGKSSLLKAGLLPRLAGHVTVVYIEASPEDTELRLLKGLCKHRNQVPVDVTLRELLAGVRGGLWNTGNRKTLIVLDQFEQWLHVRRAGQDTQLVQALRHCDGGQLQCVALVRDDFWVAANRFMQELEIRLVEGENSALVDLFDPFHARKVLAAFGRAYGRLPEGNAELSKEQDSFLDQAVEGLTRDGKIVCVRLALFADMLKGKPWTTATLSQVGGTEGLGVTFLEETFSASTAPATHRHHQKAAQAVLTALLPAAGTDIKGSKQSYDALLEASGCSSRPRDFSDLIHILDGEIRLITPALSEDENVLDTDGKADSEQSANKSYQLTHDYLVPSLRDWLTRKQKETRRGRAELRLAERSAVWNARRENRNLPKAWEHLNICLLTRQRGWTEPQRQMLRTSGRFHAARAAALAVMVALVGWGAYEINGDYQADKLLTALDGAKEDAVQGIVRQLSPYRHWARRGLQDRVATDAATPAERRRQLHARIALVSEDATQVPDLLEVLLTMEFSYMGVLRDTLADYGAEVVPKLWTTSRNPSTSASRRLRAALALASYAPTSEQWSAADHRFLAEQLVTANPVDQPSLWAYLQPLSGRLVPDLERIFQDQKLPESQLLGAANALAVFARDDGPRLARLLCTATAGQYEILYPLVSNRPDGTAKAVFANMVAEQPAEDLPDKDRAALGQRRAGAAISLLRLGEVEKSYGAFQIRDDPESLTQFVHRCRDRGVTANELMQSLRSASDVRSRFASLLALGDYPLADINKAQRDALVKQLSESYRTDPSSAIHGATGWLLRRWGFAQEVTKVDHTPLPYDDTGNREWYVLEVAPKSADAIGLPSSILIPSTANLKIYFTFVVLPPGEYWMGSPEGQEDSLPGERLHRVSLTRPLAVSAHEVTWDQLMAFDGTERRAAYERECHRKLAPEHAAFGVNWFETVAYCRWLTMQLGWPESEQCYDDPQSLPKDAGGNPRHSVFYPDRHGVRLPTEAEWEYACRAGMRTAFSFGSDRRWLAHYAWFQDNSEQWSHVVGQLRPNLRGLFDMHGNLYEWCHDWYASDLSNDARDPMGADAGSDRVGRGGGWSGPATDCRSAFRSGGLPHDRNTLLGFRVATVPSASPPSHVSQAAGDSR